MSFYELNDLASEFFKFAGLLKAPEKLVNEIYNWSANIIAQKFKEEAENSLNYLNSSHKKLNQYINEHDFKLLLHGDVDSILDEIKREQYIYINIPQIKIIDNNYVLDEYNTMFIFDLKSMGNRLFDVYSFELEFGETKIFKHDLSFEKVKELLIKHIGKIKKKLESIVNLGNKYSLKEELELKKEIKFYEQNIKKKVFAENDTFGKFFEFNSRDLPYLAEFGERQIFSIYIFLIFGGKEKRDKYYALEDWSGFWNKRERMLELQHSFLLGDVYLNVDLQAMENKTFNVNNFKLELFKIHRMIEHEILHVIQTLYNQIKLIEKRKLINFGKPHGSLRGDLKSNQEHEKDIPHQFREVEFYTRLNDAKNTFIFVMEKYEIPKFLWLYLLQRYAIEFPLNHHEMIREKLEENNFGSYDIIKRFMFDNIYAGALTDKEFEYQKQFLLQLKTYQPLKWQKAIKELTKAISAAAEN